MTVASVATFLDWSEPDKQRIQKQMLTVIEDSPKITCNAIYARLGLGHATGSSRLQTLTDMGLVTPGGQTTEMKNGRRVTLSLFVLTELGRWLMRQNAGRRDVALKRMQDVLSEREQERAVELKALRAAYLDSLRSAVEEAVEDMRDAQEDLFDGLL